jgi:hypothetical protein
MYVCVPNRVVSVSAESSLKRPLSPADSSQPTKVRKPTCALDLTEKSIRCSAQELAEIAAFWDAQFQEEYSEEVDEFITQDWWEFLYQGKFIKCKIPNFCGRDESMFPGVPGNIRRTGNPLPHPFLLRTDFSPHNVHAGETITAGLRFDLQWDACLKEPMWLTW